jgi:ribosomal protein S18 acetylase RimI-like enzyme
MQHGGQAVRRLRPPDAQAYRTLMLEAYARHPDAFTSTAAERAALPFTWWQARLREDDDASEMVLGAFDGATLAGAAGLSFEARERARHKATLFGMVVAPAARRRGHGRALVRAALDAAQARPAVRIVQLTVTDGNAAARALYETCGFTAFGVEPYAVAVEGRFLAKVHMWRAVGDLVP